MPTNWRATLSRVYVHTVGHATSDTNSDVTKLTPRSRVLPEKLTGPPQLLKKLPAFYETQRFITASTKAPHLSLSSARSIQSMPPHRSRRRSILICSFHLCLGLPRGLPPSGFPAKTQYAPILSPYMLHAPPICLLGHPDYIWRGLESTKLLVMYSSPLPCYHVSPRPKYPPQHPILENSRSVYSSLSVSDQVSHPYQTTGKIIVLYIVIFTFCNSDILF